MCFSDNRTTKVTAIGSLSDCTHSVVLMIESGMSQSRRHFCIEVTQEARSK